MDLYDESLYEMLHFFDTELYVNNIDIALLFLIKISNSFIY